jgi:hypothetical protein
MNTNAALIVPPPSTATNAAAQLVFHDSAKGLIDISDPWFWVKVAAAILVLLAIGFFVWRHMRNKASAPAIIPIVPPHIRARRALEKALSIISEPKPFTILVSDTLRTYLEERFSFRAPERTTEEFLYELQGTNLLTSDQKASLADFLSQCDMVKFAKYEPTEVELRKLHEAAVWMVNETEPRELAEPVGASQSAA